MAKEALRKQAETLYVDEGLTAKEIALRIKVSEKTIGDWKKKYNWKSKRIAKQTSPESQAKKYDELLDALLDKRLKLEKVDVKTPEQWDEYNRIIDDMSKLSAVKEKLFKDGKLSLGTHVRVIERFMSALNKSNPKLFMELLDFNKEYFTQLAGDLK